MTFLRTLEDYIDDADSDSLKSKDEQYNVELGKIIRNVAYHSLDPSKKANQMRQVLEQLLSHPKGISDHDVGKAVGIPRDRAGARRHDLIKLGVPITHCGAALNYDTGVTNTLWHIDPNGGQI